LSSDFKIIESNINKLLKSGKKILLEITEEHLKEKRKTEQNNNASNVHPSHSIGTA